MKAFNYTIDSGYKDVTSLINRLKADGLYEAIDNKVKGEIEICLVEALNNIVKHSYKEQSGNNIEIAITVMNSIMTLQLTDNGIANKKTAKPSLEFDPNDIENLPEGGMGLYIINNLMDEIEYHSEDNRNIFTMIKSIQ